MYKRTKGYILICLLVLTGLAGQVSNPTLNRKERNVLVNQLKDTRTELFNSVKGLSAAQLNFKPNRNQLSIEQCVIRAAQAEKALWEMAETTLKQKANLDWRNNIKTKDEELLVLMQNPNTDLLSPAEWQSRQSQWKNGTEALSDFKNSRQDHIQFAKTTTQDLRSHQFTSSLGTIDSYQLMLAAAVYTSRLTQQINEIKAHPSFPEQ